MEYEISDGKSRLNIHTIHHFHSQSYWAEQIPIEVVTTSVKIVANQKKSGQ